MFSANQVPAVNGWGWITQGVALFRMQPVLWLAMAFVYLAMAILLSQVPFIGWLILVLFTPLCILGALPLAQALAGSGLPADAVPTPPAGREFRPWVHYLRDLLTRAARRLFQGFADDDRLLPIMVVSTLLLGGVVAIVFLAMLLKANPFALPTILSSGVGPNIWVMALIGVAVVLTLAVLLLMTFLYTVPLILFRREHPLPSIQLSFAGALNNLGAFAIFISVFATAGIVLRILFLLFFFPLDYLAIFLVGLAALPVFIAGLYAGYQDLFVPPAVNPHD
jgi:hypothetical protein